MNDTPARTIGLPWYNRTDYPAIRAMMADPHSLAANYDLWLMAAQNNEAVAAQAGLRVVRVMIDPAPFAQWCDARGMAPDGNARALFAREAVAEQP